MKKKKKKKNKFRKLLSKLKNNKPKKKKKARKGTRKLRRFKATQILFYEREDKRKTLQFFFDPVGADGLGIPMAVLDLSSKPIETTWIVDPGKRYDEIRPTGLTVSEVKKLIKLCKDWIKEVT